MKAKAIKFDITPSTALDQGAGHRAALVDPLIDVGEPLEATVLAIWPTLDQEPIVIVTLDLLYPGNELRYAAERGAADLSGARVFVAASHTHRAPMTERGLPGLGTPDAEYMSWLTEQLTDHVRLLLKPDGAEPAHLEIARGIAAHSVHRRRRLSLQIGRQLRRDVMEMAPDTDGSVDENLVVAKIVDDTGTPIAVLWNYACHPVAHPEPAAYSSHYIHHARAHLRRQFGIPDLPVLFFQGFSGDTRPRATIGWRGLRGLIQRVVSGPQFRDVMKPGKYRRWVRSLSDRIVETSLRTVPVSVDRVRGERIIRPGEGFAEGLTNPVSFHALRLSNEFVVIGVSAELVSEYAEFTRSVTGAEFTMCVGCIDNVFGYIPTEKMLVEGGYEAEGYCSRFGIEAVNPGVESRTKQSLQSVFLEV